MKTKLIALLVSLAPPLASAFAGEVTTAAAGGPIVIGLSVPWLQDPTLTMTEEVEQEAAKLGVKIEVMSASWFPAKQVWDLQEFVERRVQGILVSPLVGDQLVAAIEAVVNAGIPVLIVESQVKTDKVLVQVDGDNVQGGRAAAKFIIDKLGNKGAVIEIEGPAGWAWAAERKAGFDEVMAKSNVRVLASESVQLEAGWPAARSAVASLIGRYPDSDAVFAFYDPVINLAIDAMIAAHIDPATKVTVGFGATPDAFQYMKEGKLSATIDGHNGQQGARALQYLVGYIRNKTMPPQKVIVITPELVTKVPGEGT